MWQGQLQIEEMPAEFRAGLKALSSSEDSHSVLCALWGWTLGRRERNKEKGREVRFKHRKEVTTVAAISSGEAESKARIRFSDTLLVKVSRDQQRKWHLGACQTCRIVRGLYPRHRESASICILTYPLVTLMHIKV